MTNKKDKELYPFGTGTERREPELTIVSHVSIRDQFAMSALQGLMKGIYRPDIKSVQKEMAITAYSIADEMLKAREEK